MLILGGAVLEYDTGDIITIISHHILQQECRTYVSSSWYHTIIMVNHIILQYSVQQYHKISYSSRIQNTVLRSISNTYDHIISYHIILRIIHGVLRT